MTDDNDERLDRAERIRKMREGNRDDEPSSDAEDDPVDEADADASAEGSDETVDADADDSGDSDDEMDVEMPDTNLPEESVPSANVPDTQTAMETMQEATEEMSEVRAEAFPEDMDMDEIQSLVSGQTEVEGSAAAEAEEAADAGESATGLGAEAETTTSQDSTRVLEFTLGDEQYCLDIEYIEEIVKRDTITRVPNTEAFVEGVVDLRGQITTILNPKVALDVEEDGPEQLIIVFDSEQFDEQGHIGWLVDDVRQVMPITDDDVNDAPGGESHINGIVDRDDEGEFVVWTTPEIALEEVSG